jgi:hypothetical protein
VFWVVGLLAVLLALPSVRADLYTDDQGMVLSMEGIAPPPIPGPFHLYTFMSGAPGERDRMVSESEIPWWSMNGIRIAFFRPLSSALLTLWPGDARSFTICTPLLGTLPRRSRQPRCFGVCCPSARRRLLPCCS